MDLEGYITRIEAAKKFNVSVRRILMLCADGKIPGAVKYKNRWYVPANAQKPHDSRIKTGKYIRASRLMDGTSKSVLIVDDNATMRAMLRELFEKEFKIYEAADGLEALEVIDAHPELSIVLLDLLMPNLDGFGVMEKMQERQLLEKLPVIMITSEATPETNSRAIECGVTDIIYKPINPTVVKARVLNTVELYLLRNVR